MKWSEEKEPNNEIRYNHVILETPLGLAVIDWKGWKNQPSYDIEINGEWIGVKYDLEEAKEFVKDYLIEIHKKLTEYLEL